MKTIPILQLTTLDGIGELLNPYAPKFELLLALDGARYTDAEILEAANTCVNLGLTYICTWGPDCERVHDLFDRIDIDRNFESGIEHPIIMSTWHNQDPIEEAFWYLRECAWPDEAHGEYGRNPVVIVERSEWQATLNNYQRRLR